MQMFVPLFKTASYQVAYHWYQFAERFGLGRHLGIVAGCNQPASILFDMKREFFHAKTLAESLPVIKLRERTIPSAMLPDTKD